MINVKMGVVKFTKPNYELCKLMDCSKEEVDMVVQAGLVTDLATIFLGLADAYGVEKALEMHKLSIEVLIEANEEKGE